jgi:hypothetical protein
MFSDKKYFSDYIESVNIGGIMYFIPDNGVQVSSGE